MYIIDLLFVLYKYNMYFLKRQHLYSKDKTHISNLIKELISVLKETKNLKSKSFEEDLDSHIYNLSFPENKEYIKHLIDNTDLVNKENVQALFDDLINKLGTIYLIDPGFNKKDFLEVFIKTNIQINNDVNKYQSTTTIYDKKDICDSEEFRVLNFEEFQNNIRMLGLPEFDFL